MLTLDRLAGVGKPLDRLAGVRTVGAFNGATMVWRQQFLTLYNGPNTFNGNAFLSTSSGANDPRLMRTRYFSRMRWTYSSSLERSACERGTLRGRERGEREA